MEIGQGSGIRLIWGVVIQCGSGVILDIDLGGTTSRVRVEEDGLWAGLPTETTRLVGVQLKRAGVDLIPKTQRRGRTRRGVRTGKSHCTIHGALARCALRDESLLFLQCHQKHFCTDSARRLGAIDDGGRRKSTPLERLTTDVPRAVRHYPRPTRHGKGIARQTAALGFEKKLNLSFRHRRRIIKKGVADDIARHELIPRQRERGRRADGDKG